ncbi:MAG: choice-of-anchor D domain-containing protein [Egibacteraceae bacterium]
MSPGRVDFGPVLEGASKDMTVTVTNVGGQPGTITEIRVDGGGGVFQASQDCRKEISAGASCAIKVTFTPGAVQGEQTAVLVVAGSAGDPRTVQLSGRGDPKPAPAKFQVSPSSLDFGPVLEGASKDMTVTVTNVGGQPGTITEIRVDGSPQFQGFPSPQCGKEIPAGGSCTITVRFTSTPVDGVESKEQATLQVGGASVPLSGTATPKPTTPSSTGSSVVEPPPAELPSEPPPVEPPAEPPPAELPSEPPPVEPPAEPPPVEPPAEPPPAEPPPAEPPAEPPPA